MKIKLFLTFSMIFISFFSIVALVFSASSPQTNDQQPPSPTSATFSAELCNQMGGCFANIKPLGFNSVIELGLSTYLNPVFSVGNQVIPSSGSVCAGTPITLQSTVPKGEWYGKGGPQDSPPISFVSEDEFKNIILKANQKRASPIAGNITGLGQQYTPPDSMNADPEVAPGITIYKSSIYNWLPRQTKFLYTYGTVICASGGGISSNTGTVSGNTFTPSATGSANVTINYDRKCVFYLEKSVSKPWRASVPFQNQVIEQPLYDILLLNSKYITKTQINQTHNFMDALAMKPIYSSTSFNIVNQVKGPNLQISPSVAGDITKLTITNNGDSSASLVGINSQSNFAVQNKLPVTIKPGDSVDLFVKSSDNSDISFTPVYLSSGVLCSASEIKVPTTPACSDNSQCPSNLCCAGHCRDPAKGVCRDLSGSGVLDWVPFK